MADDVPPLLKGTLDMLILRSLKDGADHGYGVAQTIHRLSGDELLVEEGSLYPALHRLAKQGHIHSRWGRSENNRRARFYELTVRGGRQLHKEVEGWNRMAVAISRVLEGAGTAGAEKASS